MRGSLLFGALITTTVLCAAEGKWWNRALIKEKDVEEVSHHQCQYEPCCSNCCSNGVLTAGGGWIYLSPREPDTEYAAVFEFTEMGDQAVLIAKRKCLDWDFASGYEVFASYQQMSCEGCYAWDLRGSYTDYKNSKNSCIRVTPPLAIDPRIGFDPELVSSPFLSARADSRIDYQNAAGEFGWTILCNCPFTFRMFTGVEYARIKEKFSANFTGAQEAGGLSHVVARPKMNGIGPRIGFNGYCDVWCGFGIVGKFSTALLISKVKGKFFQEFIDPDPQAPIELQFSDKYCSTTELIPNLQAKLGLTWRTRCLDCFTFVVEGGYQAAYYFGALQKLKFTDSFSTKSIISSNNFGLDGYFINASISF